MNTSSFAKFQQLGRALMLPIAVLPVAGLLLRLGQPDLLNVKWIAEAGGAIFSNLALIFAIGVAVGFAKENNGAAGLAGGIGYLILTAVLKSINEKIDMGVLAGILCGVVAGNLYNRFKDIKLPEYLAFFGGKRFVPIITGLVCVVLGLVCGYAWPPVQAGIDWLGHALIGAGGLGLIIYGILNRLLLVTGLHHILNSLVWFVFGELQRGRRQSCHRRSASILCGRSRRRVVHGRLFPDHDVWSAGRLSGDVSRCSTGKSETRRRNAVVDGAHRVSHRRDRACRIHFHVPCADSLSDPCGSDGPVDGVDELVARQVGIHLFGWSVRLHHQLQTGDQRLAADPGRVGIFPRLLFPLQLRYPKIQFGDTRTR